jgi:hypothetical protein
MTPNMNKHLLSMRVAAVVLVVGSLLFAVGYDANRATA